MTAEHDAMRAEVDRIPCDGHWWVHRDADGRRSVVWDAEPHMVWSAGDEEWCVAERERLNEDPRAATLLAALRGYVTLTSASGHTLDAARLAEMLAFVRTEPLRLGIANANADADKAYCLWQANNGKLVKALDAIGVAVERAQQAELTRDAAQARATACEERARKAEQQASDAAALLIAAETQLAEWRARAQAGADLVTDSSHIDDHMHESRSLGDIREWADSVLAWTVDPAAGTGDHEAEPGRNDEPAPVRVDPWLPRALREAGLVPSCSVGRRVVTTGEVSVDCVIVTAPETALEPGEHVLGYEGRGVLVRVGS